MESRRPFGVRQRSHPVALFGLTTLGSLTLIFVGGLFLAKSVTEGIAANVALPKTDRVNWYLPRPARTLVAQDLNIATELQVAPSELNRAAADHSSAMKAVRVESLRVRARPSKSSAQLFTLKGGTKVEVGALKGGWSEISTKDGLKGWVHSSFLLAPSP